MSSKSVRLSSRALRMCWMLSFIGVRGFFTSWATWRAISPHAKTRSVCSSSVISSIATTTPRPPPVVPKRRARILTLLSPAWISVLASPSELLKKCVIHMERASANGLSLGTGCPTTTLEPKRFSAIGFARVTRPSESKATIPTAASSMIACVRRDVRTNWRRARRTRFTIRLKALNTAPNSSPRSPGSFKSRFPEPTPSDAI